MDTEARTIALTNFRENQSKFLIVTDLCARGIDIPDVKYVINYDFPSQMKTFIHRCGRTARAEQQGTVYSFFTPQERPYVYELQ
jgi:ATP-dependent RNA helicase DDX54/DBP10